MVTDESTRAVCELLNEARELGVGVLFEPDRAADGSDLGWTISCVIRGLQEGLPDGAFPGERISFALDLCTAATSARRPLLDVALAYATFRDATCGDDDDEEDAILEIPENEFVR